MRKRILSLLLTLTLCMGLTVPAFAAGDTLDGAVSVSTIGEGTSDGTYNGNHVIIDWYPAGTVFTHIGSFPYVQTNIYKHVDGEKMATRVTTLFAGGDGFTLPADGVVYDFDLVNMDGGVDKHYYISALGTSAPAATEKPVVTEKPAGTDVSLPKISGLPKTTLALTNVVDTYNIPLVVADGWTDNGPVEVEKTVPVYRLSETGSALRYALEDANAFIYPSITDYLMPQGGTYKYTGEGYGQLTHMSSPSAGEYELAKDAYETYDAYIYEMKIVDEADGNDLVFYYTYADLSAYEAKEEQPAPVAPVTPAAPAASAFTDVSATAYYYEPVKWAVENGVTAGTTATTFSPDNTCTNAHILTFMWRAAGAPEPAGKGPFTNLTGQEYYAKAAVWAYEKGMISGTTFDAHKACTRAMTMEYFWRQAGSPKTAISDKFTDVPATASYAQAVAWGVANGVTAGTSDNTFSPDNTCTRGQIVTFLYRALV